MNSLQPVFDRLTLGFSIVGSTTISYAILTGEYYPGLIMELGFASILAAWMSFGLSSAVSRLARIEVPIERRNGRD